MVTSWSHQEQHCSSTSAKRQQEIEAAEAAGESFWSDEFGPYARVGIWQSFIDVLRGYPKARARITTGAHDLLTRDERVHRLAGSSNSTDDLYNFLHQDARHRQVVSVVEALSHEMKRADGALYDKFEVRINDLLRAERIAFELVNCEMVELESQELHAEVVAPTLRLLAGRSGWDSVERAYQEALREIHDGKPDDAITDVATALQETLTLLECEGNSLGSLIRSARTKGLLAAHDTTLADGIGKIMDWVSADRSQMGDGHRGASPATPEDAWLTVHVVGALVLRLAGPSRGS